MSEGVRGVIIVGAGVSGLAAASHLTKHGEDVVVVEANSVIGGRVQSRPGFVSWDTTSLGAEFIHGKGKLFATLEEMGVTIRETFSWCLGDAPWPEGPAGDGGVGYVWLGKSKQLLTHDTKHAAFLRLKDVIQKMYDGEISVDTNQSLEQFLRDMDMDEEMVSLVDGGMANTLCASIKQVSMHELLEMMQVWDEHGGEGDYRPDGTFTRLIEVLAAPVRDVRCNWVVSQIKHSGNIVEVTSKTGQTIRARRVIVTVPVNVLKDGDIRFVPELPQAKRDALTHFRQNPATKVLLRFKTRFWPANLHGAICADSFIPEIWADGPERVGHVCVGKAPTPKKTDGEYVMVGFATSDYSTRLYGMSQAAITEQFLAQLDEMFGSKGNPKPATRAHDGGVIVFHWVDMPFVRGGYSTVTEGCSSQARKIVGAPINNKVFFAGEGYTDNGLTADGALESGIQAAQDILALPKKRGGLCVHAYVLLGVIGAVAAVTAISILRRKNN